MYWTLFNGDAVWQGFIRETTAGRLVDVVKTTDRAGVRHFG